MPDYNPAVALGVQPPQDTIPQTLSTIANLQERNALTGYYQLQAAQQQRKFNALMAGAQAYQHGESGSEAIVANGGDPNDANAFQNWELGQRYAASHGGMSAPQLEATAGASRNFAGAANERAQYPGFVAQSQQRQTEAQQANQTYRGSVAQSLNTDQSDDNWKATVPQLVGHVSDQGMSRIFDAMIHPEKRDQVSKDLITAAMPTAEATRPQGFSPETNVVTPLGMMKGQQAAPAGGGAPNTPQSVKEQSQVGEVLGKSFGELKDDANTAKNMNFTLDQMRNESQTWEPNKYAGWKMEANQYIQPIAKALGNNSFDQPVGDYQSFVKNTGVLVRQAVKEISSRPSQMEFGVVQGQMPNPELTRAGLNQISDQFTAVNDFKQAKFGAAQQWYNKNKTLNGFEADWNSHIGPAAFLVANMNPADRQALVQKLPPQTRTSLMGQLKWAHDNGLEAMVQ